MCADHNRISETISNGQGICQSVPVHVPVTIDIDDIYNGVLKVLKRIKPFWPINNVQFKVGSKPC